MDICQNEEDKKLMRKLAGNSTALPPQICNGDDYCGVRLIWFSAKIRILCDCELLMITWLCFSSKPDVLKDTNTGIECVKHIKAARAFERQTR